MFKTHTRISAPLLALLAFCITLATADGVSAEAGDKIDLNTASVEELIKLDGIGMVSARNIVSYREKHGPFKKPEDIMRVDGIGPSTYNNNKSRIVASPPVQVKKTDSAS